MRRLPRILRRLSARRALALALVAGAVATATAGALLGLGSVSRASGEPGAGEPTAQTDDSIPARSVTMIGASPGEAANETWGVGQVGPQGSPSYAIVRYSSDNGWTLAPSPLDQTGQPLSGFVPATGFLAGEMTRGGDGALLGSVGGATHQVLLVRNPGGAFQAAAQLPEEGPLALQLGEALFGNGRAPLLAALDEGSRAGALVVPVNREGDGVEGRVLHWNGEEWSSEPIELPKASEEGGFRILAIGASSPGNAWLLAQLSAGSRDVALFHREESQWSEVTPAPLTANGHSFSVSGTGEPPSSSSQILTVTDQGIWVDGERTDVAAGATIFFKPGGGNSGEVQASWCNVEGGASPCDHSLPATLPNGPSRSVAWANPSSATPYGERVITGLDEGVSLRLEGDSFVRVLSLGASAPGNDVGGTFGAAFSGPREGWLGNETLPVHLTTNPSPNRLASYPVPFHHALTAIAAQPGAAVGALSSEALAVGDQGEVARYRPSEGWQPEELLGEGGRVETPRLRAVAWPTAGRAYAVGQVTSSEPNQMWLWRGETGLWERDPATPLNFRGNLLGIAFDPNDPSRGYAVGQQGVLLRFGKTWSQEALPPEVAGASFTSVAFAGSEAIVAYRLAHPEADGEGAHYTGGLLVNSGSGWHVDGQAAQALGNEIPWAVAGLPDGGAAASATVGGLRGTPFVLERSSPGASWQATPPYPGLEAPGSLSLFREGGALRAIASGGFPDTLQLETEHAPPTGFPPNLIGPYPMVSGYVVRQTAGGWSDEEHERNAAEDPLGEYKAYDTVFQPDPTSAVLIDPSGTQGWAVGGTVDESSSGALDTADVARYPADGVPPPGTGTSSLQANPATAAFAIAGGSRCLAPCADRANARLGPDVWLASALQEASHIAGVRAFLYAGPRLTTGAGHGNFTVPYERELARYAALLAGPLPSYAVASPTDLGPGSECPFQLAFSAYPAPFGSGASAPGLPEAGRSAEPCSSYYAIDSTGAAGTVRVIMLDQSSEPDETQRNWLAQQLAQAKALGRPAIVVGDADLNAAIAAGDGAEAEIARVLVEGGASAYFYYSPEQNLTLPLRVGSSSIPTFGTGTLGYISSVQAERQDFIGHSGLLLAEVNVGARNAVSNRAPVGASLIPNIGELALEAQDGVLLHRSRTALFAALARRPRAGGEAARGSTIDESAPYIPIPANCVGSRCANGIFPAYSFSSSRPSIGDFVAPNLASADPRAVLLGANEKPIHDSSSGLFCAYNAGTTVVTISAGGLSSSLTVTVQAGSVRRPCGTQPLEEVPAQQQASVPPPAPLPPASAPAGETPPSSAPPLPVPPLPAAVHHAPAAKPLSPQFLVPGIAATPLLPFVPLPVPTPARPTPPSGTSAVTSPVEAPEREEEHEEAPDTVSNKALAYHASEHEPSPAYILGVVVLAAFAGAGIRRRPRRGPRELPLATATVASTRSQRRLGRESRRR